MTTLARLMELREKAGSVRVEVYRYSFRARETAKFFEACYNDLPLIAQEHEKEIRDAIEHFADKNVELADRNNELAEELAELKREIERLESVIHGMESNARTHGGSDER